LAEIEGRPWAEYKRSGKSISPNQIARLLKEYKIVPDNIRVGDRIVKGYYLHQFAEAFERYLGPHPPSEPLQRYKPTATGTSEPFQNATHKPDVAFQKCEKPPSNRHCSGVADEIPPVGGNGGISKNSPPVCQHCGEFHPLAVAGLDSESVADSESGLEIPPFLRREAAS
jgi:hypothetical protein